MLLVDVTFVVYLFKFNQSQTAICHCCWEYTINSSAQRQAASACLFCFFLFCLLSLFCSCDKRHRLVFGHQLTHKSKRIDREMWRGRGGSEREWFLGFKAECQRDERYIADRCSQTGCRRHIIAGREHEKRFFGRSHGQSGRREVPRCLCKRRNERENVN